MTLRNIGNAGALANSKTISNVFMRAFERWQALEDVAEDVDPIEHELARASFEGIAARAMNSEPACADLAAIQVLRSLELTSEISHGFHSRDDLDPDVIRATEQCVFGLRQAWRFLDQLGATNIRQYAVYAGAATRDDLDVWAASDRMKN